MCPNDEILQHDATGDNDDANIGQYFKGAYDFIAITMAMGQLSEKIL